MKLHDPELEEMARIAHRLGAYMGQAQNPLSGESQQLSQQVSQNADVNGNAVFTFQAPPQGFTWTGTVTCQGAPATAIFLASIGATNAGDWAGDSIGGPIQCFANQQLVVVAAGLIAGQGYELTWTGSSDPSYLVAPTWPEPTSSAQSVLFQSGITLFPTTAISPGGSPFISPLINIPPNIRTLLINIGSNGLTSPTVSNISVTGAQTHYPYYNQPPYLQGVLGNSYLVVVPIAGVFDTAVTVAVTMPGAPGSHPLFMTIDGDTAQYEESIFYNGVIKTNSVGAAGLLINGPARILSLDLESSGSAALLQVSGNTALAISAAGASVSTELPPNSICPAGQNVFAVGGGVAAAAVTYAYP